MCNKISRDLFLFCLVLNWYLILFGKVETASQNAVNGRPSNQTVPNTGNITEDSNEDSPIETQQAQCTITAGEVQASAQATISRKLEGVCSSTEMTKAFQLLEIRLLAELNLLKEMFSILLPPGYQQQFYTKSLNLQQYFFQQQQLQLQRQQQKQLQKQQLKKQEELQQPQPLQQLKEPQQQEPQKQNSELEQTKKPHINLHRTTQTLEVNRISPTTDLVEEDDYEMEYEEENERDKKVKELNRNYTNHTSDVKKKSLFSNTPRSILGSNTLLPVTTSTTTEKFETTSEKILEFRPVQRKALNRPKIYERKKTGPRDFEIHRFNNTILTDSEIRIFTYYWKIEHFTTKSKANTSLIISPIFSISGLHLRVKATINHWHRDYLYLQLEPLTNEMIKNNSNIILETGDLFKEIQTQILFKHKIVVMDQITPTSDLISQEFLNTNSGFAVPNTAILSPPYFKDDSILIKIVIFL